MKTRNYLNPSNLEYLDSLWSDYEKNPDHIDPSWKNFFEGVDFGREIEKGSGPEAFSKFFLEAKVGLLISAYRNSGHLIADVNPLFDPPAEHSLLALSRFGLEQKYLDQSFDAGQAIGLKGATLREIIQLLQETYCGSIGVEVSHIENSEARDWLVQKMESRRNRVQLSTEARKKILRRLSESEGFELFLHTRYVAQKRFSLEGSEGLIPLLDTIINQSSEFGTEQVVLGMAHRGRLNVLANIFQKKPRYIFSEFDDNYAKTSDMGSGDVKYHKGYSADVQAAAGKMMHLSMAYNPSHLEFVAPVVEGTCYAKQQHYPENVRAQKVLPLIIHGDAALAGQGVVYETLNFSRIKGYSTHGTIHVVINNQVGFTTSPAEARSTTYDTDIAKMLEAPVFHVNGDDPEALVWVATLAAEYRARFGESVFIDIICYRRHGHNEGDEPSFTQPALYNLIKAHPTTRDLYAQHLIDAALLSPEENTQLKSEIEQYFVSEQEIEKKENIAPHSSAFEGKWSKWKSSNIVEELTAITYVTNVAEKTLKEIGKKISEIPAAFTPNPKIKKVLEQRKVAAETGHGLDWAMCEALAFGSLLLENHPVRLSGQDAQRGTFTHRHSVLSDAETGQHYCALQNLSATQAPFVSLNSTLSETGVLGFEYGVSLPDPSALVIWEAQFGDFSNSAQVIIDQFITSSEIKWRRASGLVMYLPHGYEGQGPEHSSARLERFLQLSAEQNISVCNFTIAGNLFHALRRQIKRSYRKPLVVMTPKSLLRFAPSFSDMKLLSEGMFQKIIPDAQVLDKTKVEEVILCSGKLYFELLDYREKNKLSTPIIRVEQLYPLPEKELINELKTYPALKRVKWAQEEPRNQGAWTFFCMEWTGASGSGFGKIRPQNVTLHYIGRKSAASPAVGSFKTHQKTQNALVESAFGELEWEVG